MGNVISIDKYRRKGSELPILIPSAVLICSCMGGIEEQSKGWNIMLFQEDDKTVSKLVCRGCGVVIDANEGMVK